MDCEAQAIRGELVPLSASDLGIPLAQLAEQANKRGSTASTAVRKALGEGDSPSRVQVLTFNSAI